MKIKRILFYLKNHELKEVLLNVNKIENIVLVKMGSFDSKVLDFYNFEDSDLSFLFDKQTGSKITNDHFLIIPKGRKVDVREVPQRRGGVRYIVDAMNNCDSVRLHVGGEFSDKIIIESEIFYDTGYFSTQIAKEIIKEFKKKSKKYKTHFISNEIDSKLRLTQNIKAPSGYDFKIKLG